MPVGGSLQAVAGILAFIALGVLLSAARRRISWRLVVTAVALQFALCLVLLRVPLVAAALAAVGRGVDAVTAASGAGTTFLFGFLGGGDAPFAVTDPGRLVTFAFQLLPIVIVMSALSALLWHWRVLPLVVRSLARLFERTLGTRGPAGLAATAEIFAGPVESPLLVRPYLAAMTRYELLVLMTAGLATIAGSVMALYAAMLGPLFNDALGHLLTKSVMSVPASILFAHLLLPEDPRDHAVVEPPVLYTGSMDALARGTQDGLGIYLGVLAMLLVLVSLVALLNAAIGQLPDLNGAPLSLERAAGWVFAPVAWCMGVPWDAAPTVGSLLGVKTVLNEFIAYAQFTQLPADALDAHSRLITLYALCGFANFGSIGIQLGGIGAMVPERRGDLAALAMPALLAATLASCTAAAIAGLVSGLG